MTTPTSPGKVSEVSLANSNAIDSLLAGTKWGGSLGTGVTLSYSFATPVSVYSDDPDTGYGGEATSPPPTSPGDWAPIPEGAKAGLRLALQAWSNVANIKFVEVTDSDYVAGDIRLGYSSGGMEEDTLAYAYNPEATAYAGDLWINSNAYDVATENFLPGSGGFITVVHELGHALGLKHPFYEDPDNPGDGEIVLPAAQDYIGYSVMSYNVWPGIPDSTDNVNFYNTTVASYDIDVMQYLYGANMEYHKGNDTYVYDAAKDYYECIWDAGGVDTIKAIGSGAVAIDLRPGKWSNLGKDHQYWDQDGNPHTSGNTVQIYRKVTIENATGGTGNDRLIGNTAANVLDGSAGGDTMEGGAGNDTYYVSGTGDRVSEATTLGGTTDAGGKDLVICTYASAGTYTLGRYVENLRISSSAAVNGNGNSLGNTIYAGAGNNVLDGLAGSDTLSYADATAGIKVSLATTAAQITGGSGTDTVRNFEHLAGSIYNDTLTGNGGANRLSGAAGADVVNGGLGNDTLAGGAGNDLLVGGGGQDIFRFDTALAANQDTVQDFSLVDDYIELENSIFTRLTATGDLAEGNFRASSTGLAGDANDFILYNTGTGALYYDADGNGAGQAVKFAQFTGLPGLRAMDFSIS